MEGGKREWCTRAFLCGLGVVIGKMTYNCAPGVTTGSDIDTHKGKPLEALQLTHWEVS